MQSALKRACKYEIWGSDYLFLNVLSQTQRRWKEKKNGMSAPWLKLSIKNLCLELSRKGFLEEVSCLQPMMQNASLGATSVL